MLYELLTGQPPFDGEAPVSIALKHINERPVPPGSCAPASRRRSRRSCMRSLEKDPALRYQSAEEFIAALEQARRQPTRQIVMDPTPGEPWVDEPRRLALVGVGCSCCSCSPRRSPRAPTSCSPARR